MKTDNEKLETIFNALENKECLVLKDFVNLDSPGNSDVYAIATPIPIDFLNKCVKHFTMLEGKKRDLNFSDFKLGLNVVIIDGNEIAKEGLHVHLSHIIAIVFDGEGVLEWENSKGEKYSTIAGKGDCVVVPRGAMHYFTGKLSFSALEFSDIIDYQKHHYSNIE
ncbi:MAG: cupin domain-containing protein [Chitinophagales bacterium]